MPFRTDNAPSPGLPRIAVVIIGRNEATHLPACLASVRAMDYPAELVETIYADSASTDGSAEIAEAAGARVIRLTGPPMNAARGRNAGWQAATAPLVLFLDGDVTLERDFVRRSIAPFASPAVVCVWGVLREVDPQASVYHRVFDLDWVQPAGDTETFGGIALLRRDALAAVDGYNQTLAAGEEPELARRLRARGGRIVHTEEPMAMHDLAMTRWSQYWKRMVRTGHAYAEVSAMYARTSDPLWLRESRANLLRGVILLILPLLLLLMSIATGTVWPVVFGALGFLVLVLRTAWRARLRTPSKTTLVLFGAHSHLQQIPILLGQWRYWRSTPRRVSGTQRSSQA